MLRALQFNKGLEWLLPEKGQRMSEDKYGKYGLSLPDLQIMNANAGFRLWGMVNSIRSLIESAEKERMNPVGAIYSVGIEPTLVCAFHGFRLAVAAMTVNGDFPTSDVQDILRAIPNDWKKHLTTTFYEDFKAIEETLGLLDTTPKAMNRDYVSDLHDRRFAAHLTAARSSLVLIEEASQVFSGQYLAGLMQAQFMNMVEEDKVCIICEATDEQAESALNDLQAMDEDDTYICPTCMFQAASEVKRNKLRKI